jgi:hypothetical protein
MEGGQEIKAEKTKYMFMPRHQTTGQIHDIATQKTTIETEVFLKAYSYHVGFEVLTAVSTKMAVF